MDMKIRPMTARDKPAVMDILRHTPEFKPVEVTVAEELCDAYLEDAAASGYSIFVAEADAAVVGYICYGPTPLTEGTWDIYWIAVLPKHQGQGVGGALLSFAETQIRQVQGRLVFVETSDMPSYEKTRGFYRSQQYETVCHIPDFYAPGDGKLTLQKRLR
ncbi:MAG: GNAT family N-acetyltransferase [Chloroflexota bacterium]